MSYRIRFHPLVANALEWIAGWIADYAGESAAAAKLAEIKVVIRGLSEVPHKGSLRDEIAPGLRAIPAGREGVVVFKVDDGTREVLVYAVTYGGGDWIKRSRSRG
ncbi:type II toxin-antitoxin system RelE/ParE family toxin [Paracoccus siganidrum]|uniref:Type II toxin-antitoxin system RelE/ParE family toxin n=1 Tax=Paracoccus siganidrum TaxID=1276757 RepID=A0A418ZT65_9RHOB|nr:type II toxin-antitoxin system RelE/ParE family toxin [Paracoccus siganidrum]RJL01218.1 type II toxin-antitoxin system RelE/ParE family toxin [Paracoccus siganidrum]RMC26978.1 type II toxin-antitoxin system RelE/ParE family toxin [Paracoccus siganidrum]